MRTLLAGWVLLLAGCGQPLLGGGDAASDAAAIDAAPSDGAPADAAISDLAPCGSGALGVAACPADCGVCLACGSRAFNRQCWEQSKIPDLGFGCQGMSCDGPEDCRNGGFCVAFFEGGAFCNPTATIGIYIALCHADCDCPGIMPRCTIDQQGGGYCGCKVDQDCPPESPHCNSGFYCSK